MPEPTPIEALIAKINTECREAGVPLYFVVTGVRPAYPYGDAETKSAAELTPEEIAAITGIEVHIDASFDKAVFGADCLEPNCLIPGAPHSHGVAT